MVCIHMAMTEKDAERSAFAFSNQNGLEVNCTILLLHRFAFELVWTHGSLYKTIYSVDWSILLISNNSCCSRIRVERICLKEDMTKVKTVSCGQSEKPTGFCLRYWMCCENGIGWRLRPLPSLCRYISATHKCHINITELAEVVIKVVEQSFDV